MDGSLIALMAGAVSIAFVHTLLGPDHYLPFIALSKARGWSLKKTGTITALCGLGHAAASILLGLLAVWFGREIADLEALQGLRGDWAAWALIAFGLVYFVWGLRRALKMREHAHTHAHANGDVHSHDHSHFGGHAHPHVDTSDKKAILTLTPMTLFVIFVLGPCEPLIPLMMVPGTQGAVFDITMVVGAFTLTIVLTMLTVVFVGLRGLEFVSLQPLTKYVHAIAGATVSLCGVAISFGL